VSEQPPDQPPLEDPLAEPRWQPDQAPPQQPHPPPYWQQPDQPPQHGPYAPPHWESGQQQPFQPAPPGQPPPWGYPVPAGPQPDGRQDRRTLVALAVGGVLVLAALGVGVGILVAHTNRPAKVAAAQPAPITTSAERIPTTTSAQPTPETTSPATTSPPAGSDVIKIGTTEYAEYQGGLRVQVTAVRRTTFSDLSSNPGPGVIATVRITNRSPARVDLTLVDVTLRYGANGVEADSVFDDNVHEFSGGLAVGRTATATYGFAVPRNQRDITVDVAPGIDYDSSTFAGRIS
jgi:hypothetical protein